MLGAFDINYSTWEPAIRMLVAVACAAVVGWDREAQGREAGLRTHIMVALGAAGFTIIALDLFEQSASAGSGSPGEAYRIIAAVVGGVGFLGAGAIIQSAGKVRGLTTAAGIWVIAAVGIAAGAGYYLNAVIITALALVTLVVLRRIERALPHSDKK